MHAAKVIMFPRWTKLNCSRCGDQYEVGVEYDFQQETLCDKCLYHKEALRVKRARVPHKPIGPMAVIGMGFIAAAILVVAFVCVMAVLAVKHFAARGF